MKRFFKWLLSLFYWRKIILPVESTLDSRIYSLKVVSELPQVAHDNIVYVEGNKEVNEFWYVLLKCPCGCQDKIMLNLITDTKPFWEIYIEDEKFSITPSIWRTKNCRSHFFLKNNQIIWSDF